MRSNLTCFAYPSSPSPVCYPSWPEVSATGITTVYDAIDDRTDVSLPCMSDAHPAIRTESTPNPNAIRCGFDVPISSTIRSYFRAADAAQDDLASELFAVAGVTNVLIHTQFVSIVKSEEAKWSTVRPQVERILRRALRQESAGE